MGLDGPQVLITAVDKFIFFAQGLIFSRPLPSQWLLQMDPAHLAGCRGTGACTADARGQSGSLGTVAAAEATQPAAW